MDSNSKTISNLSGIYQIVNTISEKRYVGYAKNLRTRWNAHLYDLRKGMHPNDYLQKAWNKYGEQAFKFKILQECPIEQLCLMEDYWVLVLKTKDREFGYNIKPTDPNGKPGFSVETIEKLKLANKGKKPSLLCIARRKEVKVSKEGREKQLTALKKVDWFKVRESKRKKVIDTNTGKIYDSVAIAAENVGIAKYNLSRYLVGTRTNKTNLKYLV